jgi:soluble lytic murein transglycosylase-like protein
MRRGLLLALLLLAALPGALAAATTLELGQTLYRQGRLAAAEAAFIRAMRAQPQQAGPRFWLGVTLFRQGRPAEAARILQTAAALAPRDARVWVWWGHALAGSGERARAERVLQQVLVLAPRGVTADLARQALRTLRGLEMAPTRAAGLHPALSPAVYANLARFYNPRLTAEEAQSIAAAILAFGRQYNVDPRLVAAVIAVESGFSPTAVSHKGAMGLGQLMPATAASLGVHPYDPVQNIYGTVRVLRGNLDRFGYDQPHLALAAYNAGKGAVERYGGIPPYEETQLYVRSVGNLYRRLLEVYGLSAKV